MLTLSRKKKKGERDRQARLSYRHSVRRACVSPWVFVGTKKEVRHVCGRHESTKNTLLVITMAVGEKSKTYFFVSFVFFFLVFLYVERARSGFWMRLHGMLSRRWNDQLVGVTASINISQAFLSTQCYDRYAAFKIPLFLPWSIQDFGQPNIVVVLTNARKTRGDKFRSAYCSCSWIY